MSNSLLDWLLPPHFHFTTTHYLQNNTDDSLTINKDASNYRIILGNGDNQILNPDPATVTITPPARITNISQSITVGDGNNTIDMMGNATVTAGNGNNVIANQSGEFTSSHLDNLNNRIITGDGDNQINSIGNANIHTGKGNDTIIASDYNSLDQQAVNITHLDQHIYAGEGNNHVIAAGNATIYSGNGTDTIMVNNYFFPAGFNANYLNSQVIVGNGDKNIGFYGNAHISANDGKHILQQVDRVQQNYGNENQKSGLDTRITLGNGEADIRINEGSSTILAGNGGGEIINKYGSMYLNGGDDAYTVNLSNADESGNHIRVGNGNNRILAENGTQDNSSFSVGNGDNSLIFDQGTGNTIQTGIGHNTISLGTQQQDRISSAGNDTISGGSQTYVTLHGTQSQVNTDNATINNIGGGNSLILNGNSTVLQSHDSQVEFTRDAQGTPSRNSIMNMNGDTVSAINGSSLNAYNVQNGHFVVDGDFTLCDSSSINDAEVHGNSHIDGRDGLDLTLKATGDGQNVFNANTGNETLNGAASTGNLTVNANALYDNNNNLVATTGNGDDIFNVGMGNATLTGGSGDNVFVFDGTVRNPWFSSSNTVITDFSASQGNKIELLHYGLDQGGINQMLQNSHNDSNGNAILNLGNNTVTLQGVSVSDLNASQFITTAPVKA